MDVARGHIEISGSIIAQPLNHLTLRRPELLPELFFRRRAILTAIRSRSSCCIRLRWRNLMSQSLAWHKVAGFCLMHFPRFRKTSGSRLNEQSCPHFASSDEIWQEAPHVGLKNWKKFDGVE